ncbi:hypothetical protein NDU88_008086 [Pleurodeles waltl]|uniref:Uncharacterized protein n=1 Tax=Pleurodeles waltl TaxID=8319 RepID=A0AAV7VS76_PLEWA|nr:hypothetical protein NDU88_008086 [Pleurodeles waltl]
MRSTHLVLFESEGTRTLSVRCHGDGHKASRRQGKPCTVPQGAHAFSWNDSHSTVTRRPRSGHEEKRSRKWLRCAQDRDPEPKSSREEERSRWLIANPQGKLQG